jgi:hypothetical protein
MARKGLWPTATASNSQREFVRKPHWKMHAGMTLADFVAFWPTPNSRDWRSARGTKPRDGHALNLPEALFNRYSGKNYPSEETPTSGQLNPTWVELLMGFPAGWSDLSEEE